MKIPLKYHIALPALLLVCVLFWLNFGDKLFARDTDLEGQLRKFNYLLYQIRENYVEESELSSLIDGAITGMLESLDPHSIYIPAEEQQRLSEQFRGEFEGIGISFVIQNKVLTVISPIPGTPADRLGIRAGDKIVEIEGESAYGITNEEVFRKLRGPKGTQVQVTIAREGAPEPLNFTITRDKIPIHSVETAFLLDDSTGYILLNQFTSNTSDELDAALAELRNAGMTRLVFDLRGNSGGYLDQAVKVCDKFIPGGEMLVYTKGRNTSSRREFYSSDSKTRSDLQLIVLINHGSASASEIVAGAVQDLDRGLVAGARSFGKGLVQTPIPFEDGSLVRLTTAKYYTPTGRLIQRPYDGSLSDYYRSAYTEEDTAAAPADSAREMFTTKAGRKVFGGGGVTPDVKLESRYYTAYTSRLLNLRLFFEYAAGYASEHPEWGVDFEMFLRKFQVTDNMLADFLKLADSKEIEFNEEQYRKDLDIIKNLIKSEIAQNLYNGRIFYYRVRIQGDSQVQEAVKLFPQAREIMQMGMRG